MAMSRTKASMGPINKFDDSDFALRHHDGSNYPGEAVAPRHSGSRRHFLRHLAEMVVGMVVGVQVFLAIVGVSYQQHVISTAPRLCW
jgi:hypothetical protein